MSPELNTHGEDEQIKATRDVQFVYDVVTDASVLTSKNWRGGGP